jgi:hypothetical protein
MRTFLLTLALLLTVAACDSGASGASRTVRYEVDNAASIAFTDDNGTNQVSTAGAWSTTLDASGQTPLALTANSSTGEAVTASIYVDDSLVRSRRGPQVHVELSASSSSSSSGSSSSSTELEVRGTIESLSADRVTVLGHTFTLSASTRLLDDDNNAIALSAFAVGTYVEVEGRPNGDGTYRATKMKVEDGAGGSSSSGIEVEVNGTIGAIDADGFTVAGRRFVTTATTRYLDDRNNPIARSSFRVGEWVEAEGHVRADGSVTAKKIKRDDD